MLKTMTLATGEEREGKAEPERSELGSPFTFLRSQKLEESRSHRETKSDSHRPGFGWKDETKGSGGGDLLENRAGSNSLGPHRATPGCGLCLPREVQGMVETTSRHLSEGSSLQCCGERGSPQAKAGAPRLPIAKAETAGGGVRKTAWVTEAMLPARTWEGWASWLKGLFSHLRRQGTLKTLEITEPASPCPSSSRVPSRTVYPFS